MKKLFLTTVLLAVIALLAACKPVPPTPTPADEVEREGSSGPKKGEPVREAGLPEKNQGVGLPPISEQGGSKVDPKEVIVPDPGEHEKSAPENKEGKPNAGPKQPLPAKSPSDFFIQMTFRMTRDKIWPQEVARIPGKLIPFPGIEGEYLYVFTTRGAVQFAGTFRDPLLAVGLPDDQNPGYSTTKMDEGLFTVVLPGNLVTNEILADSVLELYQLNPSIPFTTPVTVESAKELIARSKFFTRVEGIALAEFLQKVR